MGLRDGVRIVGDIFLMFDHRLLHSSTLKYGWMFPTISLLGRTHSGEPPEERVGIVAVGLPLFDSILSVFLFVFKDNRISFSFFIFVLVFVNDLLYTC